MDYGRGIHERFRGGMGRVRIRAGTGIGDAHDGLGDSHDGLGTPISAPLEDRPLQVKRLKVFYFNATLKPVPVVSLAASSPSRSLETRTPTRTSFGIVCIMCTTPLLVLCASCVLRDNTVQ